MDRIFIVISVILLNTMVQTNGCPSQCQCHIQDKAVNCNGKNLKIVPQNIPLDTQVLDLRNNDIDYIAPNTFHNLTKLTDIILNFNKLSKLDVRTFNYLQNLKIIGLGANFVSTIQEGLFDNLPSLITLDLKDNYLTTISKVFTKKSPIQRLDLHGNNIHEIKNPDFRQLPNLVDLVLSGNKIKKIEIYALRPLEKLAYLSVKSNPLQNADRLFIKNRRLTYIDLSLCQLKTVPRGLPDSVQHLQLDKNNITKIKTKDFKNKHYLAILVLDENQIDYIAPNAFNYQKNLQQLWLNANRLRKFPSPISQTVTNIYLAKNFITKLSTSDFPRNSLLTELDINDNAIESLSPKTFQNLGHLKSLWFNSNKLTKVSDSMFSGLKGLEILSLKNNKINTFEVNCFSGLSSLKQLNLGGSLVPKVTIHGNIFTGLNKLKILDISLSESLAKILLQSSEIMMSLGNLTVLNLMNNNLVTMTSNTIRQLVNLKTINLAGNRWHCDQRIRWMKSWLRQNQEKIHIIMKDDISCYSPPHLRKIKIVDLRKTQFITIATPTPAYQETMQTTQSTMITTIAKQMTSEVKTTIRIKSTTEKRTIQRTTNIFEIQTFTTKVSDLFNTVNTQQVSGQSTTTNTDFSSLTTEATDKTLVYKDGETEPNSDDPQRTNEPILADENKSTNQTMKANQTQDSDSFEQIEHDMDTSYNLVIIIIATTLSILVLLVIIIIIVIICRRREKVVYHRALQYHKENGDVVFFVSDNPQCVATLTKPSRNNSRSRSERGSTSSRPSEDITNELDTTMKIYSLDEE